VVAKEWVGEVNAKGANGQALLDDAKALIRSTAADRRPAGTGFAARSRCYPDGVVYGVCMNDSRPIAPPAAPVIVAADALVAWGTRVFEALGCATGEAGRIARGLVQANLYGHDSHGIGLVPQYVENVRGGHALPNRELRVVNDTGTLVTLDGGKGFGQAIGEKAMAIAIERARSTAARSSASPTRTISAASGSGASSAPPPAWCRCTSSTCARGRWSRRGAAPTRACRPIRSASRCRTAPHPDRARLRDRVGRARQDARRGRRGPRDGRGLAARRRGPADDDPRVLWHKPYGAILPFGEHKGWALSMMCEIVGGALSGGGVQDGGTAHPMLNNMTTFVADPSQLGTADTLPREIAALAAVGARLARGRRGGRADLAAGEPERRVAATRGRDGIPLPARTHEQLAAAAASVGVGAPR
jgi:uncharacterized oxidoreductase